MNKKTITGKLLIALLSAGMIFTGCGDKGGDDTVVPTPTPTPTPTYPTPQFAGATAVWSAVIVSTPSPIGVPVEISVGVGGHFTSSSTTTSFKDVGAVTVNGNTLKKQSNNSYIWTGTSNIWSGSNPQATWNVAGKDSVPAITNYTTVKGFPIIGEITSSSTVNKGSGHTITLSTDAINADSLIIIISAGSKTFQKVVDGLTTVNNFDLSASDLAGMSGKGIIQVVGYNYEQSAIGQENTYFINEKVVMQNVTVQ